MLLGFKRFHAERGATMIEVALLLPLFLICIFIVIWIGVMSNAKHSLVSAMNNGVRMAGTRGDPNIYGASRSNSFRGAIQPLDDYHSSGGGALSRIDLLSNYPDPQQPDLSFYTSDQFSGDLDAHSLASSNGTVLPAQYLYFMSYTAQALTQSVGTVRYPCDPRNTDGLDRQNGDSCLRCVAVNPTTLAEGEYYPGAGDLALADMLKRRIAVRCDFKPASTLAKPISALFGVLGHVFGAQDIGIISYAIYFDKQDNCYFDQTMTKPYCLG